MSLSGESNQSPAGNQERSLTRWSPARRKKCHCERSEAIPTGRAVSSVDRMSLKDAGHDMQRQYCVYILSNQYNSVLYTGVTSNLRRRVYQHREKMAAGFTAKYNVCKLVFYEVTDDIQAAIAREKQIKAGSRQKKIDLINGMNPEWRDLYEDL
jgi:putative endonuclease